MTTPGYDPLDFMADAKAAAAGMTADEKKSEIDKAQQHTKDEMTRILAEDDAIQRLILEENMSFEQAMQIVIRNVRPSAKRPAPAADPTKPQKAVKVKTPGSVDWINRGTVILMFVVLVIVGLLVGNAITGIWVNDAETWKNLGGTLVGALVGIFLGIIAMGPVSRLVTKMRD